MGQRVRRFGILQTAKVVAALYTLLGVILIPIVLVMAMFSPKEQAYGAGLAIALPILYGVMGFIFTALGCAIYNFVAGFIGGIEVELEG